MGVSAPPDLGISAQTDLNPVGEAPRTLRSRPSGRPVLISSSSAVAASRSTDRRPAARRDHRREQRLLLRLARFDDQAARAELAERFLPLANGLARRYRRPGEPLDDLTQVASVALLKALDRFDPERGHEFSTYAVPTIIGELKRYFRDLDWVVRLPRHEQELALEVNGLAQELSRRLGRSPSPQEIAAQSRLTVEEVLAGLKAATARRPQSLDGPAQSGDESPFADSLTCEEEGFARVELRDVVSRSLRGLSAREHEVVYLRFFEDRTQAEIAERIGVSQMQVSRILARALERAYHLAHATTSEVFDVTPTTQEETCSSPSQSSC